MDSKLIIRVNKKVDSVRIPLVGFRNRQFGSAYLMERAYKQVMTMLNSCSAEEGEALLQILHPKEVEALLDISNNGANEETYVEAFTPYTKVRKQFKDKHKSRGGLIRVSDEAKARIDASMVITKQAIVEPEELPAKKKAANKMSPEEARAALMAKLGFAKREEPKVEVEEGSLPDAIEEAAARTEAEAETETPEEPEVDMPEEEPEDPRAAFKRQMAEKMAGLGIGRGR